MNNQAPITVILGKRGSGKSTLAKKLAGKSKRVFIFDTLGEYGKGRKVVYNTTDIFNALKAKTFNIAFMPVNEVTENAFDWACKAVWARGDLTFVCEEVDAVVKAGSAPQPFRRLISYGRHRGIEMICISRRPPDMWRNITAQASKIISFKMHEPLDIKYLKSFMGSEAEKLKNLKNYKFLSYES